MRNAHLIKGANSFMQPYAAKHASSWNDDDLQAGQHQTTLSPGVPMRHRVRKVVACPEGHTAQQPESPGLFCIHCCSTRTFFFATCCANGVTVVLFCRKKKKNFKLKAVLDL